MSVDGSSPTQSKYSRDSRKRRHVLPTSLSLLGRMYFVLLGHIHSRTSFCCFSRMNLDCRALVYDADRVWTIATLLSKCGVRKTFFSTNMSVTMERNILDPLTQLIRLVKQSITAAERYIAAMRTSSRWTIDESSITAIFWIANKRSPMASSTLSARSPSSRAFWNSNQ